MSRSASHWRSAAVVLALTIVIPSLLPVAAHAAEKASPGDTYRSLEQLPDWSGWWYLDLAPEETPRSRYLAKAPLNPEALQKFQAVNARGAASAAGNGETLKALQCRPPAFNGFNGGFTEDVEFLFTPGRVTIANESGLLRRVFTDGGVSTDEIEATNMGTSSGHWEGTTLLVETHGLSPDTIYGTRWPGAPRIGHNVRIRERIYLRDPNTLEIALHMEAPELLTAPFETVLVYKRDVHHRFHEYGSCVDEDRSVAPDSGKERFDLTPPANLPPPPKE